MKSNINDKSYKSIDNIGDYIDSFKCIENSSLDKVYERASDIRKFEIELYWKRTTFFWTMIGTIIAGYFLTYSKIEDDSIKLPKIVFSLANLGLIFSVGWYFVNRGSKFWQINWEKHIDCLEDFVIGPLYKTTLKTDYYRGKLMNLTAPYPFSVSKINQVLNLVIIFFWLILLADFVCEFFICNIFYVSIVVFTLSSIISLFIFTHTGIDIYPFNKNLRKETSVNFERRGLKNNPTPSPSHPQIGR